MFRAEGLTHFAEKPAEYFLLQFSPVAVNFRPGYSFLIYFFVFYDIFSF